MTCLICGSKADRHHVKTRKSGGSDEEHNLMPICRSHHVEVHKTGMRLFANKYFEVKVWLMDNGWEFNEVKKKWCRY